MPELRMQGKDFFTRGIERILTHEGAQAQHLPEFSTLPPSEGAARSSLEQLLAAPNFEDEIEAFLQPRVQDKNLLRPGPYTRALSAARALLEQRCDASLSLGAQAQSQVLRPAIEVLQQEEGLRDLAFSYRSALHAA